MAAVLFLAFRDGGFDRLVFSEFTALVWWLLVLGAVAGLIGGRRIPMPTRLMLIAIAAFAAWTAIGVSWSPSAEASVAEAVRVAGLLGLALVLALSGGEGSHRRIASGVFGAIAVVAVFAFLHRSFPGLLPQDETIELLPGTSARLGYPLGYWNALGALMAIGLPLAAWLATSSSRRLVSGLAAASIPLFGLVLFLTLSRGATLAALAGLAAAAALSPRGLTLVRTLALAAPATAAVIIFANSRDAFMDALSDSAAKGQGRQVLAVVLGALALTALAQAKLGRGSDPRPPAAWASAMRVLRRPQLIAPAAIVAVALAALLGPGIASDAWDTFTNDDAAVNTEGSSRLTSLSGNSRADYWETSFDALAAEPLRGIGPGVWEFWWSENATGTEFARDAHSLWIETLAELGPIGALLVIFIFAIPIAFGAAVGRRRDGDNHFAAAGAGSGLAFVVAASLDWAWELTALPAAAIAVLVAVSKAGGSGEIRAARRPARPRPGTAQLVVGILGVGVIATTHSVLSAQWSLSESQAAGAADRFADALEHADEATDAQGYAASPWRQRALALEALGQYGAAARAAGEAIENEVVNWQNWLVLARIEQRRGRDRQAEEALAQARRLNPRSPAVVGPG